MKGRVVGLFISNGGVPKWPIEQGTVTKLGIEGDKHRSLKYHGGPERALCLYAHEVITQLQSEGHPIAPGTTGENVLIEGIEWRLAKPGVKLQLGEVVVQIASPTTPCQNIAGSFTGGNFMRVHHKKAPDDSRVYVRVLVEGELHVGDEVTLLD